MQRECFNSASSNSLLVDLSSSIRHIRSSYNLQRSDVDQLIGSLIMRLEAIETDRSIRIDRKCSKCHQLILREELKNEIKNAMVTKQKMAGQE